MKKKPKVIGLEKCLAKFPEETKRALAEEIKKAFSDPENLLRNSKPVGHVPPGTKDFPKCGKPLWFPKNQAFSVPNIDKLMKIGECVECNAFFMTEALS